MRSSTHGHAKARRLWLLGGCMSGGPRASDAGGTSFTPYIVRMRRSVHGFVGVFRWRLPQTSSTGVNVQVNRRIRVSEGVRPRAPCERLLDACGACNEPARQSAIFRRRVPPPVQDALLAREKESRHSPARVINGGHVREPPTTTRERCPRARPAEPHGGAAWRPALVDGRSSRTRSGGGQDEAAAQTRRFP